MDIERLELRHPRDWDAQMRESILRESVGLLRDREKFISYFILLAQKDQKGC